MYSNYDNSDIYQENERYHYQENEGETEASVILLPPAFNIQQCVYCIVILMIQAFASDQHKCGMNDSDTY